MAKEQGFRGEPSSIIFRVAAFERSLGARIYGAFKKLTGRGDREAKASVEMTLYFMRGLAMERIFRKKDAHYDQLVERWKAQLRAMLG